MLNYLKDHSRKVSKAFFDQLDIAAELLYISNWKVHVLLKTVQNNPFEKNTYPVGTPIWKALLKFMALIRSGGPLTLSPQ